MESTILSPRSRLTLRISIPGSEFHPGALEKVFVLDKPVFTVGRLPENDLVIDHPRISRQHARLYFEAVGSGDQAAGGDSASADASSFRLFVEDLGSANGTFVGGEKIQPGVRVEITPDALYSLDKGLQFGNVKVSAINPAAAGAQAPAGPSSVDALHAEMHRPPLPSSPPPVSASPHLLTRILTPKVLVAGCLGTLAVGLVVCLLAWAGVTYLRQKGERQISFKCDQSPMILYSKGGNLYQPGAVQSAAGGTGTPSDTLNNVPAAGEVEQSPVSSLAFLELPFPYDGGNSKFGGTDEQFKRAVLKKIYGGRTNSYFDHYYPLYPAPKESGGLGGNEPGESPIGNNVLMFEGTLDPYFWYSGHPGYDYSTFEYMEPTTPLFAAADGTIYQVGLHGASGALYVKIKHHIEGVGTFLTIYWHLHPDEFFDAMTGTQGQPITAGTRVGTMGNTGYSTGHHLHFEVRFDSDGDGEFLLSEAVDPYGYIPSADFPTDLWEEKGGMVSNYLWIHPLGTVALIPEDGGGQVDAPAGGKGGEFPTSACVRQGSLPPGGKIYYSWAPDPDPTNQAAGTGNGCVLSVMDAQGKPVIEFVHPITITLPFKDEDLKNIDPKTLKIYWKESGSLEWKPLETRVDLDNRVAAAVTSRPGKCSLMGKPTSDFIPPTTQIEIAGAAAGDGAWYDEVAVTLKGVDNNEAAKGVQSTFYSLDNGSTWTPYSGPFLVRPSGIPQPVVVDEDFFGGLPGTFLILAYSIDYQGNVENPPAYRSFSIDPSKNPNKIESNPANPVTPTNTPTVEITITPSSTPTPTPTSTPTRTPTLTPTLTFTASPTPTETPVPVCAVTLTLTKNSNCRSGPDTGYDIYTSYALGEQLVVDGYSDNNTLWYRIKIPGQEVGHCWISAANATVEGDVTCTTRIIAPPTFTPSPTDVPPPTFTPTPTLRSDTTPPPAPSPFSPKDGALYSCETPGSYLLEWSVVEDASGIAYYEWVLELRETGGLVASGSTGETSATVTLQECNYYRWYVRAVDNAGNAGEYSASSNFSNTYRSLCVPHHRSARPCSVSNPCSVLER